MKNKEEFADNLWENMTIAELLLWKHMDMVTPRYMFRTQVVIRGYIVDFYCPKAKIAIEVDGSSHIGKETYDKNRTRHLAKSGVEVLRFENEFVVSDPSEVIKIILKKVGYGKYRLGNYNRRMRKCVVSGIRKRKTMRYAEMVYLGMVKDDEVKRQVMSDLSNQKRKVYPRFITQR